MLKYGNNPKCLDGQAGANGVDLDQMLQNIVSDQDLHRFYSSSTILDTYINR